MRFFLNDNLSQADLVERYFKNAKNGKIALFVIPQTIIEFCHVLKSFYKYQKQDIIDYIKTILAMDYINVIQLDELKQAISLFEKNNVDFVDIFLFVCAQSNSAQVFSFDKDFSKIRD